MRRALVFAALVFGCACDGGEGDLALVQIDLQTSAQCAAADTMTTLSIEVRIEGTDSQGTCVLATRCIDRTLAPDVELTVDLLEDALRSSAPLLNVEADGASRIAVTTFEIQACNDFFLSACGTGSLDGTDGEIIAIPMDCSATASCPAPRACQ